MPALLSTHGGDHMKEYQSFERIGTTPHRSYYIPFALDDAPRTVHGIIPVLMLGKSIHDRTAS